MVGVGRIHEVATPASRIALALVIAALAACGSEAPRAEAPRPVLVVHPGGADVALSAYAGEIRAREESPLSFRIGGNLVRRTVDVGARVERGDLLAVLDPGDLQLQARAAQAQLTAAEAELARARADQARYAQLANSQLVSRSALDAQTAGLRTAQARARAAGADLDVARNQAAYAQLRAPRAGVIATRQAEAGQVVAAGQTVFTLAGDGGREVAIALPEAGIRRFSVGQRVLVELWSAPGDRLQGTVREIAPAADPQSRTYAARIALTGAAAQAVELGQSARVYVQAAADRAAPTVPLSALQRGADGRATVWVVEAGTHKLQALPVRVGAYTDDRVPVLSGLRADAWIVAAGGHLLREGQVVAPVDRQNRPIARDP